MKTIQEDYKAYQPYMLLDFSFSFENDVAHNDIYRTVIEIMEGINISKYDDFTKDYYNLPLKQKKFPELSREERIQNI